jgi:hypothetical protein
VKLESSDFYALNTSLTDVAVILVGTSSSSTPLIKSFSKIKLASKGCSIPD